ncbi:oligosaccharide flippase family protein [Microbacterium sp. NPDC096154]|uniref:lipopolysaccharide biosynthesis protein n=1 Tax=Microbacterium sp. NPDC096154 TaxID=3155549 RepID=UPI00332BA91C
MSDAARGIRREGAVYLAATVVQRGLPVLVLPFLTRMLVPSDVGEVALGLAVSNLASILFGLGVQFAIVRLVHDDASDRRASWPALVWRQLAFSGAALVVVAGSAPLWAGLVAPDGTRGAVLLIALALGWVLSAQGIMLSLARTSRRVGLFLVMTVVQAVVGQIVGLSLAVLWGAVGYLAGMLAGALVSAVIGLTIQRVPLQWGLADGRQIVAFSAWFVFQWVTLWVLNMSDRLIVEGFLGAEVVGAYYVAYVIGTGLSLVLDAAQSAWVPRFFASRDRDAKRGLLSRALVPYSAVVATLSLAIALAAPLLVVIAAPSAPDWAASVIAVVSLCATYRPAYLLAVAVMNDHKDARSTAIATAISAAVALGLNFLLIPSIGVIAAAIASAFSYAVLSALCLAAVRRFADVPARPVLWTSGIWMAATALSVGVAILPSSGPWLWGRTAAAAAVVFCCVAAVWIARKHRSRASA